MTTTRRLSRAAVLATAAVLLGGPPPSAVSAAAAPAAPVSVVTAVHLTFVPGDTLPVPVEARVQQGGTLYFSNLDPDAPHTLSSTVLIDDAGTRLFDTGRRVTMGQTVEVLGVSALPPGSYTYTCKIHESMWGTLVVENPT